jgi:hypothetical protein
MPDGLSGFASEFTAPAHTHYKRHVVAGAQTERRRADAMLDKVRLNFGKEFWVWNVCHRFCIG